MLTCLLCDSPRIKHIDGTKGSRYCYKHLKRIDRYGDPTARKCFWCKTVVKGVDDSGLSNGRWKCDSCLAEDILMVEFIESRPKQGRCSKQVPKECILCKKLTITHGREMCRRCYSYFSKARKRMAE